MDSAVLTPVIFDRVASVDAAAWNALGPVTNPFLRHEFLLALEHGGSIDGPLGEGTGWKPLLIGLRDTRGLAAAAPAWLKTHSYGEFVFDFSWAQAYQRAGIAYYPKLVVAVPFTPATGPRMLARADVPAELARSRLIVTLEQVAKERGLSSVHVLFPQIDECSTLASAEWSTRRDCQFHWNNRGYESFEHYLEAFTAEKRKKVRRERRRVAEAGIRFETRNGAQLGHAELDRVYALHRDTFLRHGHEPYLSRATMGLIAQSMPASLIVKLALRHGEIIAAAIFLRSHDTLFGRYWGAAGEYHSLHFEACYHQGIELAIELGLTRFEPGTQGEHKVSRGFEPTVTHSAHFIADPRFRRAIGEYLQREGRAVDEYAAEVSQHVPFRKE